MTRPLNSQRESSKRDLRIAFTRLGVLSGTCQQILYDSTTSSLSFLKISAALKQWEEKHVYSQTKSDKKLSDAYQTRLRRELAIVESFKQMVFILQTQQELKIIH